MNGTTPQWSYQFSDWLGTRRVQINPQQQWEKKWLSDPFGDYTYVKCDIGDASERHFTGKEHDWESGNDYFGARYYGSSMGRFMTPDWSAQVEPVPYAKLADPQSLNLYAYVDNNPVTVAVPPALLDIRQLQPGATVGITVDSGRLIVEPKPRRRYTLDELLAKCNPMARRSREEREWLSAKPVGGELI